MSGDDDIIIGKGPLKYWLTYRVWGVPGWALTIAIAVLGFIAGKI